MPAGALWDVLQEGSCITFTDKDEVREMLGECQRLGLLWRAGERPLDYDPISEDDDVPYKMSLDYKTYGGLYCWTCDENESRHVRWSDLVPLCDIPLLRFKY